MMMPCTSVHFRTPDNAPPAWDLKFKLNRKAGMLTESEPGKPLQFEDGTWEVRFHHHDRSEMADYVRDGCALLTDYGYEIVSETDCTPRFSFFSLVGAICWRPDMYTRHGTFEEVMAYLDGFYGGIACCLEEPEAAAEALTQWNDFAWVWLRERYSDHQSPLAGLRAAFPEDPTALANLAALWAEYQATKPR